MLSDGTAPSVLGFTPPLANLGEMRSWGWEITLKWNDQIGDNFRYNVGLNLMYNQNRVVERKEAPQMKSICIKRTSSWFTQSI